MDNLYAWVYNEMKEKNCLFDEALCHIGYNKLNEGFWCDEGCKWFQWIYKYEAGDIAGSDISSFQVDRKPVLKVGGQLHLSWNWHLYLQLKAKSVKVKNTVEREGWKSQACGLTFYTCCIQQSVMQEYDCLQHVSFQHNRI